MTKMEGLGLGGRPYAGGITVGAHGWFGDVWSEPSCVFPAPLSLSPRPLQRFGRTQGQLREPAA